VWQKLSGVEENIEMPFNFFKSRKTKLQERVFRTFFNYLPLLDDSEDESRGFVLDQAARIKAASTMYGKNKELIRL
jgi:hypothetical protein